MSRKDNFSQWLLNNEYAQSTVRNYLTGIQRISEQLSEESGSYINLFEENVSLAYISKAEAFFNKEGKYAAFGETSNGTYRNALNRYVEYLSHVNFHGTCNSSELEESINRTSEERQRRIANAPILPERKIMEIIQYKRNPDVVVEVLFRAKGVCEECRSNAPFLRKADNSPYLEIHHKKQLAHGGQDLVDNAIAVCPNCHRKLHYGV